MSTFAPGPKLEGGHGPSPCSGQRGGADADKGGATDATGVRAADAVGVGPVVVPRMTPPSARTVVQGPLRRHVGALQNDCRGGDRASSGQGPRGDPREGLSGFGDERS
jgi:hypothetical protein